MYYWMQGFIIKSWCLLLLTCLWRRLGCIWGNYGQLLRAGQGLLSPFVITHDLHVVIIVIMIISIGGCYLELISLLLGVQHDSGWSSETAVICGTQDTCRMRSRVLAAKRGYESIVLVLFLCILLVVTIVNIMDYLAD